MCHDGSIHHLFLSFFALHNNINLTYRLEHVSQGITSTTASSTLAGNGIRMAFVLMEVDSEGLEVLGVMGSDN